MNTQEILELERKNTQNKLDWELKKAREKNREQALNAGINIISAQLRYNMLAMFYTALRDEGEI